VIGSVADVDDVIEIVTAGIVVVDGGSVGVVTSSLVLLHAATATAAVVLLMSAVVFAVSIRCKSTSVFVTVKVMMSSIWLFFWNQTSSLPLPSRLIILLTI
jgi:hypothetical protein